MIHTKLILVEGIPGAGKTSRNKHPQTLVPHAVQVSEDAALHNLAPIFRGVEQSQWDGNENENSNQ